MNTSKNNNISSVDPLDRLIHEKGLRIKHVLPMKDLDILLIVFNNKSIIKAKLSNYKTLSKAKKEDLNNWKLSSNGIGIRWETLNEDLSAKGFLKEAMEKNIINRLQHNEQNEGILF